ncbi:MAG: DUF1365 domain-containing protein [Leptospiraceae bacterium]|nr:DUF1365 domain-containing protein [Leptospiraceae bacterium]
MNSQIYEITIIHKREYIKQHLLKYKIFMFYIDLDEIDFLNNIPLLSYNKFNLYSLYDKDHFYFYDNYSSIKENLLLYIKENQLEIPDKVFLLTNLRFLGYVFNPVSFYYCFKNNQLIYIISEVNNTFHEQKPILVPIKETQKRNNLYYYKTKKDFYVSPFVKYDTELLFRFNIPEDKLLMQVDSGYFSEKKEYHVKASMSGIKKPLNTKTILIETLKFPFVTFKIIIGIHWHALLLWMKKIPYFKKNEVDNLLKNQKQK